MKVFLFKCHLVCHIFKLLLSNLLKNELFFRVFFVDERKYDNEENVYTYKYMYVLRILRKEYIKAVYCHLAYLMYMQNTS